MKGAHLIFLGNTHMWNLVQVKARLAERMGSWTDALRRLTVAGLVLLVAYQLPILPAPRGIIAICNN